MNKNFIREHRTQICFLTISNLNPQSDIIKILTSKIKLICSKMAIPFAVYFTKWRKTVIAFPQN